VRPLILVYFITAYLIARLFRGMVNHSLHGAGERSDDMKNGKGKNEYHLNESTLMAIVQENIKYSTDQEVTSVRYNATTGLFVVTLNDKQKEAS
jgi:hypothetical protein